MKRSNVKKNECYWSPSDAEEKYFQKIQNNSNTSSDIFFSAFLIN